MMDRYAGKPLLKVLDGYVLRAIGGLGPEQEAAFRQLEPKLAEAWQLTGHWTEMVEQRLGLPADLSDQILAVWQEGQANAAARGARLDPLQFTIRFVDNNFPAHKQVGAS